MACRLRRPVTSLLTVTLLHSAQPQTAPDPKPLPDIPILMHQVEAHQRNDETRLGTYIYRQTAVLSETDGHGGIRKQQTSTSDVFWISGVPVEKVISKNGKPLSPDELKKEDERIDREVRKAKERREKNDSKGEQTDPHGNDEVTVSRILELGTFSNPRRVQLAGRDTIAVDYAGDPHAKTRSRAEELVHDVAGTIWIDEGDREVARAEGHFFHPFKIGGGLVANIREGTSFSLEQAKINDDVWLPTRMDGQGAARILLLFSFNGAAHVTNTDFRRFHTTSTVLPGIGKVTDDPTQAPTPPPPPQP